MAIIDSDAHVLESERTWEFMEQSEQDFRPFVVVPKNGEVSSEGGFGGFLEVNSEWLRYALTT